MTGAKDLGLPTVSSSTVDPVLRRKPQAPPQDQPGIRLLLTDRALPTATTLGLIGLWETASRAGTLPSEVPPPTVVFGWLASNVIRGDFWVPVGDTVVNWSGGLVIGGAVGIALGVLLGLIPLLERLLRTPIEFLRPIPSIVYLPLLILMLGSRPVTAITLAAVGALWPVFFQTLYGVLGIDSQAVETARVFGLRRGRILWNVTLPSILPYVAVGLRVGSSLALIVAISAELVGGVPGLGTEILASAQNGRYEAMYGWVVVVGLFGLILNAVLQQGEKRLLPWHKPHRKVEA